ncbi:MAG: hypothetical protein JWN04_6120 [Myxococcaceae bacterium]|nr:hypothetical protein [Myxococcaceae bacterium]
MNAKLGLTLSCALALALTACSDDSKDAPTVADSGTVPTSPAQVADASVPTMPNADGGAPIPLLTWVNDLVDNHTTDDAAPDTVDDKNIADDENPGAYDNRF